MVLSLQVTMICCLPIFLPDALLRLSLRTSSLLEGVKGTPRNQKFEKYPENSKKPRNPGKVALVLKNKKIMQKLLRYFSFKLNLICP